MFLSSYSDYQIFMLDFAKSPGLWLIRNYVNSKADQMIVKNKE